ncbi:hypothetical protein JIN85_12110 [Luteolibacter pohnpeiensis]|uniref:Lipoprotein n=1 Tax=Luteolibacter pohnpeiensis TaxID=454153 RepID=A0A934S5V5_9BACT|nr:hypothetical protein [Luteolibacter pohnpeiensis]MBK1883166.1 hypothetical protein [Luteolibacter pohnpeiensis]
MALKLQLPVVAASMAILMVSCATQSGTTEDPNAATQSPGVVEPVKPPAQTEATGTTPIESPFHMPDTIYDLPGDHQFDRASTQSNTENSTGSGSGVVARPPTESTEKPESSD